MSEEDKDELRPTSELPMASVETDHSLSVGTSEALDQALGADDTDQRRDAFLKLLGGEDWRLVLAPHVISCQGYTIRSTMYPDWATFKHAASIVAKDKDKVLRSLELAGVRFSDSLLYALARELEGELVEPILNELEGAEGGRKSLLLHVMQAADDGWTTRSEAKSFIEQQLRRSDGDRVDLLNWLARSGALSDYVEQLHDHPPTALEEWGALGRSGVYDEQLFNMAMATMPHTPAPILYLMRLDPLPDVVVQRMMASARGDWVPSALEVAIIDGLDTKKLLPLAEIGVRMAGRGFALATAWVGSAKLAKEALVYLSDYIERTESQTQVSQMLWIDREMPSPDRALEHGRRGDQPDLLDAAALVRQLRGDRVRELVKEILSEPREEMLESILRPLCAVNPSAAREVLMLCETKDNSVRERAKLVAQWPDVMWPADDRTLEIDLR